MDMLNVNYLIEQFGERWVLRDLDFFPEKFSDMHRLNKNYNDKVYFEIIYGNFVGFKTEKEALEASLKIYAKVLKKDPPRSLLERYYECVFCD